MRPLTVAVLCLSVAVLVAGCAQPIGSETPKSCDPPAELTNETAKRAALECETTYVSNVLREQGYPDWGIGYWTVESATIRDRGGDSMRIAVEIPYHYRFEGGDGDGLSRATYAVSNGTIQRVEGTEIDPV